LTEASAPETLGKVIQMRNGDHVEFRVGSQIFFFDGEPGGGGGIGLHPLGRLEQGAGGGGGGLGIGGEELAVHNHRAAIFVLVWGVLCLVGDILDLALGCQQGANGLGIGHRIHVALVQGQAEFARRKYNPGDLLGRVNAVGRQYAVRKDERRRSHAGNADSFAAQDPRLNGFSRSPAPALADSRDGCRR
jgi:hypothetical protein